MIRQIDPDEIQPGLLFVGRLRGRTLPLPTAKFAQMLSQAPQDLDVPSDQDGGPASAETARLDLDPEPAHPVLGFGEDILRQRAARGDAGGTAGPSGAEGQHVIHRAVRVGKRVAPMPTW